MIYYISDLHFGHANIIKLCGRPFQNLEEMNGVLINNYTPVIFEELVENNKKFKES